MSRMGNNIGNSAVSRMGISSMAMNTPNINKATVKEMMIKMRDLPVNPALPLTITKVDFDDLLKSVAAFEDPDIEIFQSLFELFAIKGDDTILYRDLIVGVVGCLIVGTLEEKFMLAFELYDIRGKNDLNRADLRKVLHSINDTASYFGDNVLEKLTVDDVVSDIFYSISVANVVDEETMVSVEIKQCVEHLSQQESVLIFVNNEGPKKFGQ